MEKKLCPKIILEGTRLTLKTEIAFTLNEHPRIVDRFHISTRTYQWQAHGKNYDFRCRRPDCRLDGRDRRAPGKMNFEDEGN
jgi:hypothetical protein